MSPHIHDGGSIRKCMLTVLVALLPASAVSVWTFGLPALATIAVCLIASVGCEWFVNKFMLNRQQTISDGSAAVTGLLLALNLPAGIDWWIAVLGSIAAVGIAKMCFGGLGCNIWNPALVGRVFLLISFPAAMTTWPSGIHSSFDGASGASAHADASSGATILSHLNSSEGMPSLIDYNVIDMLTGKMNGSMGETGAIAIILGLVILLATRTISWHIPFSVILSAAFFSWILGGNPILDVLAGGLLLGAVFMATDYVTSPMTHSGQIVYGIMIGLITIIIRRYGAYPEGVSFAILLMNSFVPIINRAFKPVPVGEKERRALS